jgi:hypothetical protein
VSRRQAKNPCNDFAFSFLHSTCSKTIRSKHAVRRTHRVATLLVGHPDVSASSE